VRVCEQCGAANTDDAEFCGGCGEFLEWDDPAGPAPARPDTPTPAGTTAAAGTAPAQPTGPGVMQPTGQAVTQPTGQAVTQPTAAAVMHPTGPAPVQPGDHPVHRPRRTQAVVDEPPRVAPGELACPACGVGNDPTRRFCRHCGTSLHAVTPARLPWWRRLLGRLRRRGHAVGYRPRGRGPGGRRLWPVLVFLLAAVLAVAAIPGLRAPVGRAIGAVRDRIAGIEQADPARATASSGTRHPAASAIDGATNIYWAPDPDAPDAAGQWIAFDMAKPVRLQYLVFYSGISPERPQFLTEARPENLDITLTAADGRATTKPVRLEDRAGKQEVPLIGDAVTRIQVTIRSAYGAQPGRHVAIAEVEAFVRR
jgi:hypothetical protein